MLALLYKDYLLLRREKLVWLTAVLALVAGTAACHGSLASVFVLFFGVFWVGSYSNAYDFKYGGETIMASLPVRRASLVGSKYLLTLVAALGSVALASAFGLAAIALGLAPGPFPWGFPLAGLSLCLVYGALALGAYFRLGYLKSRWATVILFAIPGMVVPALFSARQTAPETSPDLRAGRQLFAHGEALGIALLLALALFGLSCLYSRRLYRKREF